MNDTQPIAQSALHGAGPNSDYFASLGDLHQTLWRRKWYVFASLVGTVALGAAYLAFAEPLYIAQARVVIERKELPLQGRQYHGGPEFFGTQVEVMRSPQVLRGVMQSLGLPRPDESELAVMSSMLKALTVNPVLGTNVLNVGYRCADPDEATRVVQSVIREYMGYAQTLERESHAETLHLLTLNERQLREEATKLEAEYQTVHKQSPLLGQGKDASSVQENVLLHLGQKLTETKNQRIDLENQLYALAARPAGPQRAPNTVGNRGNDEQAGPPQAADGQRLVHPAIQRSLPHLGGLAPISPDGDPSIAGDVTKVRDALWRAQVHEKELAQTCGPKHPERRAVQQEISMWEKLLRESIEANTSALEQDLTAMKMNENRLDELFRSEFDKTKELDDYILNEQRMAEELHRVQTMHESTRTELRQWELDDKVLATGKGGVTVQVIEDPANSLPRKLWPRSILVLAACLAFGFIGGAGLASVVEYRSRNGSVA